MLGEGPANGAGSAVHEPEATGEVSVEKGAQGIASFALQPDRPTELGATRGKGTFGAELCLLELSTTCWVFSP